MSEQYGIPDHKAESNTTANSQVKLAIRPAVINVFFDGTGNNIFNTEAQQDKRPLLGKDSYLNAKSNVGMMYEDISTAKALTAVYIDGIGTTRYQADNLAGGVLGQGKTGVTARARSAFREITKELIKNNEGKLPAECQLNVYGFSRGAAAARHFVHLVNEKNAKQGYPKDWADMNVNISFVGLFDTVSSYGVVHSDDVTQLHLNFGKDYALKVVHLMAGDEYRENFAVTTIASAAAAGIKSYELTIPGAHSDVGGGYHPVTEEVHQFLDPKLREFVYAQGWYKPGDKQKPSQVRGPAGQLLTVESHIHERRVLGECSSIAHALMVDKANAHMGNTFTPPKAPKHPDALVMLGKLRAFAQDEAKSHGKAWRLNEEVPNMAIAQRVRHALCHLSFEEGSGVNGPRLLDGHPKREAIPG